MNHWQWSCWELNNRTRTHCGHCKGCCLVHVTGCWIQTCQGDSCWCWWRSDTAAENIQDQQHSKKNGSNCSKFNSCQHPCEQLMKVNCFRCWMMVLYMKPWIIITCWFHCKVSVWTDLTEGEKFKRWSIKQMVKTRNHSWYNPTCMLDWMLIHWQSIRCWSSEESWNRKKVLTVNHQMNQALCLNPNIVFIFSIISIHGSHSNYHWFWCQSFDWTSKKEVSKYSNKGCPGVAYNQRWSYLSNSEDLCTWTCNVSCMIHWTDFHNCSCNLWISCKACEGIVWFYFIQNLCHGISNRSTTNGNSVSTNNKWTSLNSAWIESWWSMYCKEGWKNTKNNSCTSSTVSLWRVWKWLLMRDPKKIIKNHLVTGGFSLPCNSITYSWYCGLINTIHFCKFLQWISFWSFWSYFNDLFLIKLFSVWWISSPFKHVRIVFLHISYFKIFKTIVWRIIILVTNKWFAFWNIKSKKRFCNKSMNKELSCDLSHWYCYSFISSILFSLFHQPFHISKVWNFNSFKSFNCFPNFLHIVVIRI